MYSPVRLSEPDAQRVQQVTNRTLSNHEIKEIFTPAHVDVELKPKVLIVLLGVVAAVLVIGGAAGMANTSVENSGISGAQAIALCQCVLISTRVHLSIQLARSLVWRSACWWLSRSGNRD